METGKKSHRDRKNGAAHEAWMKQKQERNARKVVVHLNRPRPLNGKEDYNAPQTKEG